jgi:dCMP deaminase
MSEKFLVQTEFSDLNDIRNELEMFKFDSSKKEEQKIKDQECILQMEYAFGWAKRLCYAKRRKVGAVIYKDRNPISVGYNGTPVGEANECEYINSEGDLVTKPNVIHAEANALDKLATKGNTAGSQHASIFTTSAPCLSCAMRILNCQITTVYFTEIYRNVDGLENLIKHNITIKHINMKNEKITTIFESVENDDLNNIDKKIEGIIKSRDMLKTYKQDDFLI